MTYTKTPQYFSIVVRPAAFGARSSKYSSLSIVEQNRVFYGF